MKDSNEPLQHVVKRLTGRLTNSLVGKILLSIVSLFTSSTLIVCVGYLFLTGYYFGGPNTSILDLTVGIIPYDRASLLTAGIFYFMIIVVVGLFIYIVTIEKMNKATFVVVLTGGVLITYSMVLVYFTESTLAYFFRMLYFWSFPITTIVAISYFYSYYKYPIETFTSVIYFMFLIFNLTLIDMPYISNIPSEMLAILMFIFIPIYIFLKNRINLYILKKFLYLSILIPFVSKLIVVSLGDLFLAIFLAIVICTLFIIPQLLYFENLIRTKIDKVKVKRKLKANGRTKNAPLAYEKPFTLIYYIITLLLILIAVIPVFSLKSGEYVNSIIEPDLNNHITYTFNGEKKEITGMVIGNQGDTYYIADDEQKLIIIKTRELTIEEELVE